MLKTICLILAMLLMSGCCEVFGICTSVNVHTDISSPNTFASAWPQEPNSGFAGTQTVSGSTFADNARYLPPDGNH